MFALWQESDDKPRQCIVKKKHYSPDKGPYKSRLWSSQWLGTVMRVGP